MGIVVLRSTTPCVVLSSFNSAALLTLNSIDSCSSRAVPGAVMASSLRVQPLPYSTRFQEKYKACCLETACGNAVLPAGVARGALKTRFPQTSSVTSSSSQPEKQSQALLLL